MPSPRRTDESSAEAELPPTIWDDEWETLIEQGRCIVCGGPRGAAHVAWMQERGLDGEQH